MSLKRFNGWAPEQVHFDADGNETGRTKVEPEWDDEQRQLALDLLEYESQVCPGCGGHYSQTRDKTLGRDVRDAEDECLDCAAIKTWRDVLHSKNCTKDNCECGKRAVWVEGYSPSPSRT